MKDIEKGFLEAIEAFMQRWDYMPSEFGRAAIGDPNFVFRVRSGERSPTVHTVDRVLAWMDVRGRAHEKGIGLRKGLGNGLRRRMPMTTRIVWTPKLDARIGAMLDAGKSWAQIAAAVGTAPRTVQRRAQKLGLREKAPA